MAHYIARGIGAIRTGEALCADDREFIFDALAIHSDPLLAAQAIMPQFLPGRCIPAPVPAPFVQQFQGLIGYQSYS